MGVVCVFQAEACIRDYKVTGVQTFALPIDGSDQSASIEEKGMENLTNSIDKISDALGEEKLGFVLEEELPIAKKLRAHINN